MGVEGLSPRVPNPQGCVHDGNDGIGFYPEGPFPARRNQTLEPLQINERNLGIRFNTRLSAYRTLQILHRCVITRPALLQVIVFVHFEDDVHSVTEVHITERLGDGRELVVVQ